MAAADPPSFVGSKRKLRSETNENIPAKRREVASPKDTRIALPRPRLAPPAAQFVPYRQGTVRHLRLDDHHFLAAKSHVEALIAYKYKRQELLLEALYPLKNEWARAALGPILREANYRLALIGDAVLKMAILDARYNLSELNGATDNKVQAMVSDERLAVVADTQGISAHLRGWYQKGYEPSKKTKATTVEAIIGAVWLDAGDLDVIKKVVANLLGQALDDGESTPGRHEVQRDLHGIEY